MRKPFSIYTTASTTRFRFPCPESSWHRSCTTSWGAGMGRLWGNYEKQSKITRWPWPRSLVRHLVVESLDACWRSVVSLANEGPGSRIFWPKSLKSFQPKPGFAKFFWPSLPVASFLDPWLPVASFSGPSSLKLPIIGSRFSDQPGGRI